MSDKTVQELADDIKSLARDVESCAMSVGHDLSGAMERKALKAALDEIDAAVDALASRASGTPAESKAAEMEAQLRHLVDDLTHCPNPDDPIRRYVRPGAGLMFSNMVNAVASLLASGTAVPAGANFVHVEGTPTNQPTTMTVTDGPEQWVTVGPAAVWSPQSHLGTLEDSVHEESGIVRRAIAQRAAPVERLTDEELSRIAQDLWFSSPDTYSAMRFARAVESAVLARVAQPQRSQKEERAEFEAWLDRPSHTHTTYQCGLMWLAWLARAAQQKGSK